MCHGIWPKPCAKPTSPPVKYNIILLWIHLQLHLSCCRLINLLCEGLKCAYFCEIAQEVNKNVAQFSKVFSTIFHFNTNSSFLFRLEFAYNSQKESSIKLLEISTLLYGFLRSCLENYMIKESNRTY